MSRLISVCTLLPYISSQYDDDKLEVEHLDDSIRSENAAQVQQETRQLISRYVGNSIVDLLALAGVLNWVLWKRVLVMRCDSDEP